MARLLATKHELLGRPAGSPAPLRAGVGGGTAAFARLVEAEGRYSCEAVAVVDDGASNKREILRLAPVAGGGGGA